MLKDFNLEQLVSPLLEWYGVHARVLPWREDPAPYRVWVSEIMLQQTRVEAVKPYFERFVKELPDAAALAACGEEQLLKLWEGLGYYNRVRNMQAAARTLVAEYGGELPADYEELLKLKGIGHYTAGAIASIAYGIPVPAVDGNVLRILMRVSEDSSDIMKQSVKSEVEKLLLPVIPKDNAGSFTQAMMELGATVCGPNGEPACNRCPWESYCLAKKNGSHGHIPVRGKAKPRKIEEKTVLIICDGEKVLPVKIEPLEEAKHIFSHIEWHMRGYMIRIAQLDDGVEQPSGFVFAQAEVSEEKYAIPSAFARYTKYMNIRLGQERYE